jgi:hypothetical protein
MGRKDIDDVRGERTARQYDVVPPAKLIFKNLRD